MSKKQSSLDSFLTDKKPLKKDAKELVIDAPAQSDKKVISATITPTTQVKNLDDEGMDFEDEFELEPEEEEDIIFEGAPVELCPTDSPPCCLLQSTYDGKSGKAFLYLLDERANKLYGWYDNTGHVPYCLSDLKESELKQITPIKNFKKITGYKELKLKNLLLDKDVIMSKILVTDPLAIAGGFDSLRDKLPAAWEANIRYHQNYLYDRNLLPGMYYQIKNNNLEKAFPDVDKNVEKQIINLFKNSPKELQSLVPFYLPLLLTRIPYLKRVAIDVEVYTKSMSHISDPKKAAEKVISIAFAGNDGLKKVYVLKRTDVPMGTRSKELGADVTVQFYDDEVALIKDTFKIMKEYPIVITFNGDNYDLPYLFYRAERLKIDKKENPIILIKDNCRIRNSLHFDAYRFFNQAAIKVYAFGSKYNESSLNSIGKALLNESKVALKEEIGFLNCFDLAYYNYSDSKITLELTTFNDSVTMRLIIMLMRLTGMTFEDITRQAVSSWIRNWLFAEHRRRNYLIPRPEEIISSRGDSTTSAIIKGKKYKGAIVVKPDPGIHFNVTVLDFASLYPSIIKTWNLSYETMNCVHPECKNKKVIPDTTHWICTKNYGLMSMLIGFIRDIRVNWFKPKSKDKSLDKSLKDFYDVIQNALKVIINASYGVFGADHFPFYCPPLAEATTAIGRQAITKTIEKGKQMGVNVLYGDTDSVFLKNPTQEQIKELIAWSDTNLQIDLDVDKVYRYLALSERKKNYLGVYPDGSVDVKGLLGKKRNTPPFLRDLFTEIVKILSGVEKEEAFTDAKKLIEEKVQIMYSKLKKRQLLLEELAFKVQLNKNLDQYVKTTPQHVKAAKILAERTQVQLGAGDLISFVKTKDADGVKPIEIANTADIDIDKYLAQMDSTLTQVLEPIGISFDKIIGIRSLDDFF